MKVTAEVMPLTVFPPEDQKQFGAWIWGVRKITQFDMDVIGYPRTCMAKASSNGRPLLYVPVTPVLMLESLAPDPELTKSQKALALWRIVEEMDGVMKLTGMYETYFITKDRDFADKAIDAGFEEVKDIVLKRKLNRGK
jgi:hypothetical protein